MEQNGYRYARVCGQASMLFLFLFFKDRVCYADHVKIKHVMILPQFQAPSEGIIDVCYHMAPSMVFNTQRANGVVCS